MKRTDDPMSMASKRLRYRGLRPHILLLLTLLVGMVILPAILATPVSGMASFDGVSFSPTQGLQGPAPATPVPGPGTGARLPGWAFLLLLAMILMFIVIIGLVVLVALRAWYVRSKDG